MKSYTFTARSAAHPERMATFTLYEEGLSIRLGAPLNQIIEPTADQQEEEENRLEQIQAWLKPMAISLLQRSTGPFDLSDVDVHGQNGSLGVVAWVRTGGLRLSPVVLTWDEVDNPEAAQAFVREVRKRKKQIHAESEFPGPFDYWITWFVGGLVALGFLWAWIRSRVKRGE